MLRAIEEEGVRKRGARPSRVTVPTAVALYILNHKRGALAEIETRHHLRVTVAADDSLIPPEHRMERSKTPLPAPEAKVTISLPEMPVEDEIPEEAEEPAAEEEAAEPIAARPPAEENGGRRRRRRRRRRDGQRDGPRDGQRGHGIPRA